MKHWHVFPLHSLRLLMIARSTTRCRRCSNCQRIHCGLDLCFTFPSSNAILQGAPSPAEFLPESSYLLHLDLTSNPGLDLAGLLAQSRGPKGIWLTMSWRRRMREGMSRSSQHLPFVTLRKPNICEERRSREQCTGTPSSDARTSLLTTVFLLSHI